MINSWIQREEYLDAYRYLYPTTRGFSWRWDGNKGNPERDLKGRLDHCLVTPDLIESMINVNYQFTTATDHASIIIELRTEAEEHGKGTFRAPPYIQNDKIYHKLASRVIADTILENKVSDEKCEFFKRCLLTKRSSEEKYLQLLESEEQTEEYQARLQEAQEQYAIALSLEPTVEEISHLPTEVKKGTELEIVLMKLKVFTLNTLRKKVKLKEKL